MNSARSTLTLLGATLVGRLSDAPCLNGYGGGRRVCLLLGLVSTAASLVLTSQASSLAHLWVSLLPQLLQQNTSIIKALFSDYHTHMESSSAQRASTAGLLGMVGGLAMMLGPMVGSSLLTDTHQATLLSLMMLLLAACCVFMTPSVSSSKSPELQNDEESKQSAKFWSTFDVPSARSPPALFLLTCRLLSTLSFHIFSTISSPSLRYRFDFGPAEYGQFFSFIGLCYAVSQYLSQYLLRHNDSRRKQIFVVSVLLVGVGRYLAFTTSSLFAMYLFYAGTVLASGVVSTLFSSDTSQIAKPGEAGAFFGVVATIESGAGMVGPIVGGSLAQLATEAPLFATSALTGIIGVLVWLGYEPFVLEKSRTNWVKKSN